MKKSLLILTLAMAPGIACADSLVYGGAAVGQSKLGSGTGSSIDVHVGTGILPFIGIEAGYTRSGDMDTGIDETTTISSTYVALRPSIDFGPLRVYARGGLQSWQEDVETSGISTSDDGVDIMYGVGAEYFMMGPTSIGASYQTFNVGGEEMSNFTLNATINFM